MNILKTERSKMRLTQEQAAKSLNISLSMLSQVENGTRNPSIKTMEKLAELYKKPVGYLFFGEPITKSNKNSKQKV